MMPSAPARRRRQSGFALLITITLLAFLVLLLVSLSALTRVETQVAANNQQVSQARQNALMALNVALGRLQASAGPDTRVTATADLVSGRNIDKKNWTGVWNASAVGADKNIAWLVSGTAPAGAAGVTGALSAATGNTLVELVGEGSTDISNQAVTGNRVQVETQPITSSSVTGLTGPQTVGNFAYWVGDEGVKAKVSTSDPWDQDDPANEIFEASDPDTTSVQADAYRFIHSQRLGIEGVDAVATGTPLASAYPADVASFRDALPKILSLTQLPLANPSAQTTLALAGKNRFHDLTASSRSVLADAAKGGLKRDLTAWVADSTANPAGSAVANDDYITPGDSSDATKYGLPKWALIRDYATTLNTGAALAPRPQSPSQQGVYPIITYARMGYNITCAPTGGIYKINVMPVLALWNPYNVPIAADPDGSFEFCVKYVPPATTMANLMQIITYVATPILAGEDPPRDYFNVNNISISTVPGVASQTAANTSYYGTGTVTQFWRFKVKLTRALGAGESRLFTIDDSNDDTQYVIGQSTLSDAAVDSANAVYLPSRRPLTLKQMAGVKFWNTEPASGGGIQNISQMEIMLTPRVPAGTTTAADIENYLRTNAHQTILGFAVGWGSDSNTIIVPPTNTGTPFLYQRFELNMSTLPTSEGNGSGTAGTPRWLANFNPHSSIALRKPIAGSNLNPSYLRDSYIQSSSTTARPLPNADGVNVSAGTRVSNTATAQNLVIREFQPAGVPLFSIAQLQHANVSAINLNPAYAIGNSLPNLYVSRTDANAQSPALINDSYTSFPNGSFNRIYDLSYLLNKALWDGYFFSTVPTGLTLTEAENTHYRLPNARHQLSWSNNTPTAPELAELKVTSTAAKRLLLDGGFNINSTSIQAWRALLHAHNGVATDPLDPANKKHPYSRFTAPVTGAVPNAPWLGYRILSDGQINALATAIVAEIRTRGPFLSLADFVNRRLAADATGLKGPLQAAIDATTGSDAVNTADNTMQITHYFTGDINTDTEQRTIYKGSSDVVLPGTDGALPSASRAAFAPGFLTQADLLTAFGASITPRSDTFRIRAYGDVINPTTGTATPETRAWCEAIVQRLPDYIDSSMPSETDLTTAPASPAKTTNEAFGRRFKIVSFRWLTSHDL